MNILLVNPPIYDFSAYDFWLKPYSLLKLVRIIRNLKHNVFFFDYLDRFHPGYQLLFAGRNRNDKYHRGTFPEAEIEKPKIYSGIKRRYKRFGWPRSCFSEFLQNIPNVDITIIQCGMSYWYLGVKEVIEDIRTRFPKAIIVLTGIYPTLCYEHAKTLEADVVIKGKDLLAIENILGAKIDPDIILPDWSVYPEIRYGVIKLTNGCPFKCSYCSAPLIYDGFEVLNIDLKFEELTELYKRGIRDIAFYDDALLYKPKNCILPFIEKIRSANMEGLRFHTPNALHPRFMKKEIVKEIVSAGFETFYLGFESISSYWQEIKGGKVYPEEFKSAVEYLKSMGVKGSQVTAYVICGHPESELQMIEESLYAVNSLGIRSMLAEFSPIPNTPDGENCRKFVDLDEPLTHNKTAFTIWMLGEKRIQSLKALCRKLNRKITP